MPLEDHIGDICRKARLQTKMDLAQCAAAAGLEAEDLQTWETEGAIGREVHVAALAELVGLDAGKAMEVANGWVPDEVDLSRWAKLRVITTAEGFEVNSFVVWDPKSRQAAVFDTGWFADDIFELAEIEDLKVEHLLITHMVTVVGELIVYHDHLVCLNQHLSLEML